ncbi:UDP-MurNac-pentapeptide presynthetase MurF [Helicobacter valdiviensis]|uniref:UDP-MurNac-pentapeptide presynthetase MurF n=1 Tax=Helicobacter valdiviensis TaxID=1458358 RepID=A0A2W6PPN2_9HELI|nr:UDP-N-acetylmuramoyl-tripeptide--D-alanyl-D-alanine ligase [Helicobacter valdiviensis]PZT48683.1 UDP-MurNac-pentapeptide presynthetase MurF [Helicobacter valdiviensis]
MQTFDYFLMLTHWVFLIALGYYVITNFQWYHYKFLRVVFKHHKFKWHILYFVLPVVYFIFIPDNIYSYLVLYFYIIALAIWAFNLSKKLVFTGRVLRFFFIYISFILFNDLLFLNVELDNHHTPLIECVYLLPLPISLILSNLLEKILLNRYKKLAKEKLDLMPNLKVIAVTGSYGKTSLKNFLFQMLHENFKVYATPRSVNTLTGIIADINQNLSPLTDIYIVEAGARTVGNIKEIIDLISPQIAVVGKIGEAHIEYFKDIQTIYAAKYEILESYCLQKAYIYEKNTPPNTCLAPICYFPNNAKNIHATLEGTTFSLELDSKQVEFSTKILGAFNVINIGAAIAVAKDLGIETKEIIKLVSKLEPTGHRLSKINVNGKLILDDSYNGNLDGMLEAIRLSSLHEGKKIIVTPGLVESNEESNIKLAKAIDKVFDIAIITGELNSKILQNNIHSPQKIILKDKNHIENLLKSLTHDGDLILFANDAPSYI